MSGGRHEPVATVNLGGLLRAYREAAGLSQTQLMVLLDMKHPSSIHVWETGKRCVPDVYLPKLEAILGRKLPRAGVSGQGYDADPGLPSHTHRGRLTKVEQLRRDSICEAMREIAVMDLALYAFEWWEQDAIEQERKAQVRRSSMRLASMESAVGGLMMGPAPAAGRRAA